MGLGKKIKLLWGLRALSSYWKGGNVNGFDPRKSLLAGAKTILRLILGAIVMGIVGVLSDAPAIKAAFLAAGVPDAIAGLVVLLAAGVADAIRNAYKHLPPSTDPRIMPPTKLVGAIIALALLPGLASAQESGCQASAGFLQYVERGQDHQNWTLRGLCAVESKGGLGQNYYLRAQLMRSQDASELSFQTLKSIEVFAATDRHVFAGFRAGALAGTFFDVDSRLNPADPRQWTVGGYLKLAQDKDWYALAGAGHVSAVGGFGGFFAAEVATGENVSFVVDAAVPFSRSNFAVNPFIIKSGVMVRR